MLIFMGTTHLLIISSLFAEPCGSNSEREELAIARKGAKVLLQGRGRGQIGKRRSKLGGAPLSDVSSSDAGLSQFN